MYKHTDTHGELYDLPGLSVEQKSPTDWLSFFGLSEEAASLSFAAQ